MAVSSIMNQDIEPVSRRSAAEQWVVLLTKRRPVHARRCEDPHRISVNDQVAVLEGRMFARGTQRVIRICQAQKPRGDRGMMGDSGRISVEGLCTSWSLLVFKVAGADELVEVTLPLEGDIWSCFFFSFEF